MKTHYSVIIVGAGAGGLFASYELAKLGYDADVLMLDKGRSLDERHCPIGDKKTKSCVSCEPCSVMNGFGGAGLLSDGKYNITTEFGGDLHLKLGKRESIALMEYVDEVLVTMGGEGAKLFSTASSDLKRLALQNNLHMLDAKVRHLGTDRNFAILKNFYRYLSENEKTDVVFNIDVVDIDKTRDGFAVSTKDGGVFTGKNLILATGRSGSRWMSEIMSKFGVEQRSDRVDIGVRVELPAAIWKHITDEVYESKIVYKTDKYNDLVRTFCMNPYGRVVTENTNGIITVNGHSFAESSRRTGNTNFALLVTNRLTEPFRGSNEYGESIARLSNMLGGGVLLQRFGDLVKGRRSSAKRMEKCFTQPTLDATPGDLSLVIPKRQLDDIIEMVYALDKIAPGTSNEDTLLYGVEVKFYNSEIDVDENLETKISGLYAIGDATGVTHSLSQASASGVHVARKLSL